MAIPNGQTVSHYRNLEYLGSGGMEDVSQALDLRLDRPVALKFLDGERLKETLSRGPLPVGRAIDLALQIARGLGLILLAVSYLYQRCRSIIAGP
ncbi:MAG TPA: hypothetical protein VML00_06555 [Bacteroidota bacterium]|nr:hypothetical protein [Bacteroidota bacterium]